MKKLVKIFLVVILALSPKLVNAATGSASISCPTKLNAGATFNCVIKATSSDGAISGFQTELSLSSGIACSSFSSTNFNGAKNGNTIAVYLKDTGAVASPATVGTLSCALSANASGNQAISLTSNKMGVETEDGTSKVYPPAVSASIHVNSSVNTLDSLTLSAGTLSPEFSINTTSYTATVDAASVIISAVKTDSTSTVSGTGSVVLKYGANAVNVVVKSETGVSKTYKIVITRPDNRESVNTLKALSVNAGTLSPSFSAITTSYKVTVESTVTKITFAASLTSEKSSFVSSQGPRTVNLNYGSNKVLISVKAENEATKAYTIEVTRKDGRNTDATLSSLTLSAGNISFDKTLTEYTMNVAYETENITVNATPAASTSKVNITGSGALKLGINKVTIVVTAENGTTKIYTLTINRSSEANKVLSSNKNLKNMTISGMKLDFSTEQKEYTVKIKEGQTSLDIETLKDDETSTIQIIGNENLKDGSVIQIIVTAEDNTTSTYKIIIEKESKVVAWKVIVSILSILVLAGASVFIFKKTKKKKQ